jgi:dienelactone hydrolase
MSFEPVTIESSGCRLYGTMEVPEGAARGGVVVVHGWGGCRVGPHRILVEAARALVGQGCATLRFDLRGRGESEGEPLEADLDAMIDDTVAAIDSLRERIGSGQPLVLLGMCSGGNVALAAAALRHDVQAVATWSTYPFQEQHRAAQDVSRTRHFAWVYLGKAMRPATWRKLLRGRINFAMVRRALFGHYAGSEGTPRDLQRSRRDILGPLAAYQGRMFFLYGGADPEAAAAQKVFGEFFAATGAEAAFESIPSANHNFYSLEWKATAIETTCRWIEGALAPNPA